MRLFILLLFPILCQAQQDSTIIFGDKFTVEPVFPGGEEALKTYVTTQAKYHFKGAEEGIVYVQFLVDTLGGLNNIHVTKGVSNNLDAAAINVVKSMPNWIPGKRNKKLTPITMTLPIRFVMPEIVEEDLEDLEPEFPTHNGIISWEESDPEFPGGLEAMKNYIEENLEYPTTGSYKATVYVQFLVDSVGVIKDVEIKKGYSPELDAAAVKLISNMPNWKPGSFKNKPKATLMTLPIKFDEPIIYSFSSDTDPSFPGGLDSMINYIHNTIIYPDSAIERGEQGIVYVNFVVMKDGSIEQVKTLKGISSELDAEAERVISGMPNWIPGEINGKPANVYFTIPIHYRLTEDEPTQLDKKAEKLKKKLEKKKKAAKK